MKIAILSTIFVLVAGAFGRFLKPTPEQLRPLAPEPGAGQHDDHGHHH